MKDLCDLGRLLSLSEPLRSWRIRRDGLVYLKLLCKLCIALSGSHLWLLAFKLRLLLCKGWAFIGWGPRELECILVYKLPLILLYGFGTCLVCASPWGLFGHLVGLHSSPCAFICSKCSGRVQPGCRQGYTEGFIL